MKKIIKIYGKPSLYDILIWIFCVFSLLFMFLAVGIHPASLYCSSFIFMGLIFVIFSGFSSIKSIEIDKDEIIFHKKNETIIIKQNEIEEFKVITKGAGLDINIQTNNSGYNIHFNYLAARAAHAFLIENAPFINNFSVDGKNLWFSNMNFYKKWHNNVMLDNRLLVNFDSFAFFIFCGFYLGLTVFSNSVYYDVVTTDDLQTANNIQELITKPCCPTTRHQDGFRTTISISAKDYNKAIIAMAMVADSEFFNDNVSFYHLNTKNKKRLNYDTERRLKYIPGVQNAQVELNIPEQNMSDKNPELPAAKINLLVQKDYDKTRIERAVKNMIKGSLYGFKDENINILFNVTDISDTGTQKYSDTLKAIEKSYYSRAKMLYYKETFGNKDYTQSINLLKKLAQTNNCYESNLKALINLQNTENELKKYPDNYKLYIKLGDIKNVPEISMFCAAPQGFVSSYYGAIDAYTKALELNPKAVEVYEKRGDAWAECGYKKCEYCKLKRTEKEDENVIKDYEKAIELTGGNDRLYEKLADRYKYKNPQKALELYDKIQNYNEQKDSVKTPLPYLNADGFEGSNYGYIPLKKAECYAQIKDYDSALNLIDKILNESENTNIIQQANNLKFLYNWKAKHYKEALKNSDNCNVWVCKVLGLIF